MKLTFLTFLLLFLYIKYSTYENFYYYIQPEESEELETEEHAEVHKTLLKKKKKQNKLCKQTVFNNCCPEYHINVHNIKGISNVTTPRLNLTL